MNKICITTLGCDKNRCDSEMIAAHFVAGGDQIVDNDGDADILVVNTCGFINSARKESINAIIGKFGYNKKIIVTGCLVEKYRAELQQDMPEVFAFCTLSELVDKPVQKLLSTPKSYAYIKIAEGCNRVCAFCTIPDIKGKYKSRAVADIINEIKYLAVPEVILVAQDTTSYGIDIGSRLTVLLREISGVECVRRVRLHYCYPDMITSELIDEIAVNPKICKYIDIPLQHCNARILSQMNRAGGYDEYAGLIKNLRARVPGIVIRSTIMVGFPTETEEEFAELVKFLNEVRLDYVGFFAYSREEGTASYGMRQVPALTKKARLKTAEIVQMQILNEKNKAAVGSVVSAVYDGGGVCRTDGMSPEVDPCILVAGNNMTVGAEYRVKITGVKKQNLTGVVI